MSNGTSLLDQISQAGSGFWQDRTAHQRTLLRWCAVVVLVALVYLLLVAPALNGQKQLQKELPMQRKVVAEINALAIVAQNYQGQTRTPANAMTKESLETTLKQHGINAPVLNVTSDFAKVQLNDAAFASIVAWLDEAQKIDRIVVLDATMVAQPVEGIVNATLTLKQQNNE
jgi:general secretion pathway protein M